MSAFVIQRQKRKWRKIRARWWRLNRLFFPSPAELRFISIMGGKYWQVDKIKHWRTHFSFAIVWSLGRVLSDEQFGREVFAAGRYFVDFGNDVGMAIEVDGHHYHLDVVREFERDSYLYQHNWRVIHIQAVKLWNDPAGVQRRVLQFIYR